MSTSPEAKQAAEKAVLIATDARMAYALGYDAATAKHTIEEYKTAIEQIVEERTAKLRAALLDLAEASAKETAKLREELELAWGIIANASGSAREKETKEWQDAAAAAAEWRDRVMPQLAHHYVHIERYFPKGYNPDDEPWLSIRKHYRIAEKQMAVLERMLSDKNKEWEAQPDAALTGTEK